MATSSTPITASLLSNRVTHAHRKINDGGGQCSFLRRSDLNGVVSTRRSKKDLVVRRATPEVAGDPLSPFSLITSIPFVADHPWLSGICGLMVAVPLMIQRLVAFTKQLDAAAQTVENIADVVEEAADGVDKAAENLKESLPEGPFKRFVAYIEKLAERTSDGADKVSDVMDVVEEIDDKLEEFLDKNKAKDTGKT